MKNQKNKPAPTPADYGRLCNDLAGALRDLLNRVRPPEEARRHFQTARLELLKGLRAVLDARIERRPKGGTRGEQISVE